MEGPMGNHDSTTHGAFFWSKHAEILFTGWPGSRGLAVYLLALFLVAAAAAAAEFLASFIRILSPRPTAGPGQRFLAGIAGAAVHALRMGLLYLVMLAVMSFNVGVLIAAVAGHALGFMVQGSGLGGRWLSDGLANGGDLGYGKL
ncbi:Copper transporter 1 [Platanthera zijinensis]|uniref:Copper transport protein n=1 Tax=Platanthera zijinensis TaxID=2320716 RepID=A0AAP0BBU3_9ASPA